MTRLFVGQPRLHRVCQICSKFRTLFLGISTRFPSHIASSIALPMNWYDLISTPLGFLACRQPPELPSTKWRPRNKAVTVQCHRPKFSEGCSVSVWQCDNTQLSSNEQCSMKRVTELPSTQWGPRNKAVTVQCHWPQFSEGCSVTVQCDNVTVWQYPII